jgi:hypothetical protein
VPTACAIHTPEFEAVERRDPTWSAIHLLAAMAWCAAISLGRAPEAICFGILAAVTVIRLPSTARLYPALHGVASRSSGVRTNRLRGRMR